MKIRIPALTFALLLGVFASFSPTQSGIAQSADEKDAEFGSTENTSPVITLPKFENAPISEVLKWANTTLGVGFLYNAADLRDNAGDERRISLLPPEDAELNDCLILVFESLRAASLVPMRTRGMAGVQYQVMKMTQAAGYGVVTTNPDDLEELWFGTFAYEARTISYAQLGEVVRQFSSKDAVIISMADTATIIVSDFVDNLFAIYDASEEAQTPALRDDDQVTLTFRPAKQEARSVYLALEASRTPTETFQATLHAQSSTILLSGKRKEAEDIYLRLETMDSAEALPAETLAFHTYNIKVRPATELMATLRQHFEREVKAETFRVSHVSSRNQLLVECSGRHWTSALALIEESDRTARSEAEAEREKR